MGSFPYTPDQSALDPSDDQTDRLNYAFNGAVGMGIDMDDEVAQILQVHNLQSQVNDEERTFMASIKDLTGYEPFVIGSKAMGTAVEGGVSDLDLFIAASDENAFEDISYRLAQILKSSKNNDTEERHPQLRVFNAKDQSKQVGVGYGPDASTFVQSVVEATLELDEPTRDAIKQAKIDAANLKDTLQKSETSFKTALDILLGIKRMEAPIDESTGVYGDSPGQASLPPEY